MLEQLFSPFLRSRRRWLYGLMAGITAFSLAIAAPKPGNAGLLDWLIRQVPRAIQIIQISNISDQDEMALGGQINDQISRQVTISNNANLISYIDCLGQNLAQTNTRPDIDYTFQVVEDPTVNAFASMGGYVYLQTGLIEAADNESELASVIAHEISHIAERHSLNQLKEEAIRQGLLSAAGLDRNSAIQLGAQLALGLPKSRSDEYEADRLGLESMIGAGYAPIGAVDFMKKLQQLGGNSPPEILSTHPDTGNRIQALSEAIPAGTAYNGEGLDSQVYQSNIDGGWNPSQCSA